MDYDELGLMLEHKGMDDDEIDAYFAHQGVKGMKWGVRRAQARSAKGPERLGNRNNKSVQRRLDRISRVASGTASRGDKVKAALLDVTVDNILLEGGLRGGAQKQLDRGARTQNKIKSGKKNTTDILLRVGGADIRELDYSYTA